MLLQNIFSQILLATLLVIFRTALIFGKSSLYQPELSFLQNLTYDPDLTF